MTESRVKGAVTNIADVCDLRSALEFLAAQPGELLTIKEPVDPYLEMAGVVKQISAGPTVKPPTKPGPCVLFEKTKGYDIPVVAAVMGTRERTALLLGTTREELPRIFLKALDNPIPTTMTTDKIAPCQEVVHRGPVDVMKLLPVPSVTEVDAGPYFTMGLLRAEDPETGESDVTVHRMCVHGPDKLSIFFTPGRHIDSFRQKAEAMGKPLPVSINIGLDPAIYIAACFEEPTTPLGMDELSIAGAVRGRPVELVDCVSVKAKAIARAEVVLEGEILPNERVAEDAISHSGRAMPEFPGYVGLAQPSIQVIKITAVTTRRNPILQTIVGPGLEHCNLVGVPTEASILRLVGSKGSGGVQNVYCHPSGGGKYIGILQYKKVFPTDEGRQRQAALGAFTAFAELKHVILVDEDVDIYNTDDVLWAMTTRYQGDVSTVFIPGVRCHPLDPSATPAFDPSIRFTGISCKAIFDCTVPFALKDEFLRSPFKDVDLDRFLKSSTLS